MLKKKIEDAFNEQINSELYSGYLYLSMAAHFESLGLPGFANWMKMQAKEEDMHAMKFYSHIHERGGTVVLKAIAAPPTTWESPIAAFEEAYKHEQHITSLINNLVDLAIAEKDHASNNFLQWFVAEQVEEEASVDEVIQHLKLTEGSKGALFMIDKQLATRVFDPAAEGAE